MRIVMKDLLGAGVLAGALDGKSALARLIERIPVEPSEPESLFLDFANIEVATASFLRESILAFRDLIRSSKSQFYPIIANANANVRDELVELVRSRNDVLMTCKLDDTGKVVQAGPLGELDPKQKITFDLVTQRGETDAGELMRLHGGQENLKHATAWNNRLAALSLLGLIVEVRQGRSKRYRPILSEVKHGIGMA